MAYHSAIVNVGSADEALPARCVAPRAPLAIVQIHVGLRRHVAQRAQLVHPSLCAPAGSGADADPRDQRYDR
jgi:hypothetical protein